MKLKRFFKSLTKTEWMELILLIFGIIKIIEILFIGPAVTTTTEAGIYTCEGGVVKVCSGSQKVASYLGVE